jgi:succinoglycan biosynthesis transport protein ExoP
VPDGRVSPRPARNATLALVVGTILGAAVALFREYRDDTIKTRDDFARVAQPVPVLASIPSVAGWQKEPRRPHVVTRTGTEDASIAAEAYRALRTAVRLLGVERPQRTIQFTSAMPGEGKTTTLANLALVLVSAGQRVVMVDCDLRRPSLHTAFGLRNADGFTSVLAGEQELMAAIQRVPGEPALALLASGAPPPNPSELLGSKQTSELLFALQSQFDIVLVDSPPVLSVTDASVLSLWVDTTLVVASAGVTLKKQLGAALEVLRQADASVSGAVLNRVEAQPGYGYGYYGERTDQEGAGTRSKERSVELGPQLGPATSDDEIRTLDQRRGA